MVGNTAPRLLSATHPPLPRALVRPASWPFYALSPGLFLLYSLDPSPPSLPTQPLWEPCHQSFVLWSGYELQEGLDTKTDCLTVTRNVTLTLTSLQRVALPLAVLSVKTDWSLIYSYSIINCSMERSACAVLNVATTANCFRTVQDLVTFGTVFWTRALLCFPAISKFSCLDTDNVTRCNVYSSCRPTADFIRRGILKCV
jgi:hypothetical protein